MSHIIVPLIVLIDSNVIIFTVLLLLLDCDVSEEFSVFRIHLPSSICLGEKNFRKQHECEFPTKTLKVISK